MVYGCSEFSLEIILLIFWQKKKNVCPKSSSDIKLKSFILILLKEEILRQPNIDSICMPVNNHSYINLKCKRASWGKMQTVQCEEKKKAPENLMLECWFVLREIKSNGINGRVPMA